MMSFFFIRRRVPAAIFGAIVAGVLPLDAATDGLLVEAGISRLDDFVVTASGVREAAAEVPQTLVLFNQEKLAIELPRSAVDFFSENAIGFAAPIAPGHSFLSLRGAITNQIGYDDSSEVSVLINGRRAGTVNLSKLAPIDAYSIEVLRGPSSVIYGSSAIGGVVNFITKNGINSPGNKLSVTAGSWDRYTYGFESGGRNGKIDYYFGAQYQESGDYKTGRNSPGDGTLENTDYTRRTANLTLGYALTPTTRAEVVARTDGLYDVGHRGVTYSLTDHDDRYNRSIELKIDGADDGRATWSSHSVYSQDVEVWYWSQNPLLAPFSNAVLGDRPGITRDDNTRKNHILGQNFNGTLTFADSNTLLAGLDLEYTRLRNDRIREAATGYIEGWKPFPAQPTVKTAPVNIAPLAYNYDSRVVAPYIEDTQRLFDDRLTVKAGARFDVRWQGLKSTVNEVSGLDKSTHRFDAVTYRFGASFKTTDWLTLKANVGTGFRAPNPNELNGNNFSGNGIITLGNPKLKNEESLGWEIGASAYQGAFSADATYFSSDIKNRITSFVSAAATAANGYTTTVGANLAHARTEGVEFRLSYDIAKAAGFHDYSIEPHIAGTYNFKFKIDDPTYRTLFNNQHIPRVNAYQGTIGIRAAKKNKWDVDVFGVLSGPTYESGATHGLINADYPINPATGQPNTGWIFKKESYWLLNARFGYSITSNLRVFGGANNLLDLNYDPSFLARYEVNAKYQVNLYKSQSRQSTGSSAPGRELFAGIEYRF